MGLRGPEDLLLEAAASAVGPEDALRGALDARRGPGRQGVLGEVDALFLQLPGLPVGEVDLDGRPPVAGHVLAEFVAVLSGLEEQRNLLLGDVGTEDLDLVGVGTG